MKDVFVPLVTIVISAVVAFYTATYAVRREQRHGRFCILELCRRYIINVKNAFDFSTTPPAIRNSPNEKKMYVEELKRINNNLDDLVRNFYFGVLVAKYPMISKVLVQLHRELVEHELQDGFALNTGSINDIKELYNTVKKDLTFCDFHRDFEKQIAELFDVFLSNRN